MESKFIRIVGGPSDKESDKEKEERARKEIVEGFFKHREFLSPEQKRELNRLEYPKSETELALIDFANQEISRLMQEAGMEPYSVPAENIYILPPELYKKLAGSKGENAVAAGSVSRQVILIRAEYLRNNPVPFGASLIHESTHLKGHLAAEAKEVKTEEEGKTETQIIKTIFRGGLRIYSSQQKNRQGEAHEHFAGLDEAIVTETEKRLLGKMLNLPVLKKEKEWLMSEEAQERKKELAEETGIPEDDIVWVDRDGDWLSMPYFEQRRVFNYICDEIQKEFPDRFRSPDDVYKVFLNAHFTGRLIELRELVEQTFGEKSFRTLGNMGTDDESAILHLEAMKDFRKGKLSQRKEASS